MNYPLHIRDRLAGGDRRTLGNAPQLGDEAAINPETFDRLAELLGDDDPLIRSRAAHALQLAAKRKPQLLEPHKETMLQQVAGVEQWEVRHLWCQMVPLLELSDTERRRVFELAVSFLKDRSSIVKTCAMQLMADLALQDKALAAEARPIIEGLTLAGTAAMRARGRKLIKLLNRAAV